MLTKAFEPNLTINLYKLPVLIISFSWNLSAANDTLCTAGITFHDIVNINYFS